MLDKIKNLVGTVAPALGSALGSPLGGAAISMIADKLGVPNNQQAVEKAIRQATPDEMLKLKEADNEFEVKMKELDVDVFRLETEDKQNARAAFSKDWTTKLMGLLTLSGFMGYIFLVTLQPPEQNSEALINLVLGYLGGLASAVISFYFGASQSKDD
jgi:hypothetical protein|tara:strand:+ start:159 stop:632 length:474 start_codon:yes stop_codon:yes gene_type:complete